MPPPIHILGWHNYTSKPSLSPTPIKTYTFKVHFPFSLAKRKVDNNFCTSSYSLGYRTAIARSILLPSTQLLLRRSRVVWGGGKGGRSLSVREGWVVGKRGIDYA